MGRLLRTSRHHRTAKPIPLPMAYYLLRVPGEGIDHFMLEVDATGTPHREIGLGLSGRVIYATADDHGGESRCIWHQLFGWEIEPWIVESEPLTAVQFDAVWATRPSIT